MGRQPTDRFGRIDRAAMRTEAERDLPRLGVPIDPDRIGGGPLDRRPADHRDRQGHLARRARADHGRADRGALGRRGRAAVRRRAQPARRGPRAHVHLAPLRRGVRPVRHRHGHARRQLHRHRPDRRDHVSTSSCARWSAGMSRSCSPSSRPRSATTCSSVEGLTRTGVFHDISFTVRAGEIVGLAGLVGAGRSEVARAVFGVDPYDAGSVRLGGRGRPKGNPRAAMARGLALVPEDRRKQGLVLDESVVAQRHPRHPRTRSRRAGCSPGAENARGRGVGQLSRSRPRRSTPRPARCPAATSRRSCWQVARDRAEGAHRRRAHPRHRRRHQGRGHRLLSELARPGIAILMISSELPEVLGMADRVLVMREGRITAEIPAPEATPETVMFAATRRGGRTHVTRPRPRRATPPAPAGATSRRRRTCARPRDRHRHRAARS